MKHSVKIGIAKNPAQNRIVSCRSMFMRERFLRFLFGEKRKLTILVLGDSVQELTIQERVERNEKNEVTA